MRLGVKKSVEEAKRPCYKACKLALRLSTLAFAAGPGATLPVTRPEAMFV